MARRGFAAADELDRQVDAMNAELAELAESMRLIATPALVRSSS